MHHANRHIPRAPSSPPSAPTVSPPVPAPSRHLPRVRQWACCRAAIAIPIMAASLAIHWWTCRLSPSITDDAFVEAHIVNVAPEMVSGRVVRLLVEENDQVQQGQVLGVIEPVHYRDQVEQAR